MDMISSIRRQKMSGIDIGGSNEILYLCILFSSFNGSLQTPTPRIVRCATEANKLFISVLVFDKATGSNSRASGCRPLIVLPLSRLTPFSSAYRHFDCHTYVFPFFCIDDWYVYCPRLPLLPYTSINVLMSSSPALSIGSCNVAMATEMQLESWFLIIMCNYEFMYSVFLFVRWGLDTRWLRDRKCVWYDWQKVTEYKVYSFFKHSSMGWWELSLLLNHRSYYATDRRPNKIYKIPLKLWF